MGVLMVLKLWDVPCFSLRVLLMMGVLFCCGAGFFIRRRMYPSPLRDEPAFNVSFTRHPVTTPGTVGVANEKVANTLPEMPVSNIKNKRQTQALQVKLN